MAKYYNKTLGSLAVGLRGGRSAVLSGKSWTEIPTEDEGAEDLVRAVKRGYVVRSTVDDSPAAPAPVAAVAPAAEEVQPSENVPSAPADEPSSESLMGSTEKTLENPRRRKG